MIFLLLIAKITHCLLYTSLPEDKLDIELINVLGRSYMNLGDYENALDTYLSFIGKAKEDVKDVDIWLYSCLLYTSSNFNNQ